MKRTQTLVMIAIVVLSVFSAGCVFPFKSESGNAIEDNDNAIIQSNSLNWEDPEGWPTNPNMYLSDLAIAFVIHYDSWDPWIPGLYSWEDSEMTVTYRDWRGVLESNTYSHYGGGDFSGWATYDLVFSGYSNQLPYDRNVNFELISDYIWWIPPIPIFSTFTDEDSTTATRGEGPAPFPVLAKYFPIVSGEPKGVIIAWYFSHAYVNAIGFSKPIARSNEVYDVTFVVSENGAQDVGPIILQRRIEGVSNWITVGTWTGLDGQQSKTFTHSDHVDVGASSRNVFYRVLIAGSYYRWRSSQSSFITIRPLDTTPPVISIISPTDGLITNQDVVLSYTVGDDESVPANIDIIGPPSGTSYNMEGSYEISISATDEAGNTATKTISFVIDKTPPEITFSGTTEGYYNIDQTIFWDVTDAHLDGITASRPSPTTFSSEGTHTVSVTAMDLAGNTASKLLTIVLDKTAPVIIIIGPSAGYYNVEQIVEWSVTDLYLDEVFYTHASPTTFTEEGTYQVTVSADDLAGNFASASSAVFVIDKTCPETMINFGEVHFIIDDNIHLTSTTPVELLASDLSGVAGTYYKVSNEAFDSGWLSYLGVFSLDSLNLEDGNYALAYYSTDIAGNSELIKSQSLVLDNSPPEISWEYAGFAFQDGILFNLGAIDATGVSEIVVSIRERDGPIITEIPMEYIGGNRWQAVDIFDSTTVPDGYYELVVEAKDIFNFMTTQTFDFSIRNWAVLELLPSTESNNAGRTMPVKFALRVVAAVDPNMPFVVNQELDIFITDTSTNEILQHAIFGDGSTNYRINEVSEHYITNFKTLKTPTTYEVSIYRKDLFIGSFSFATVK